MFGYSVHQDEFKNEYFYDHLVSKDSLSKTRGYFPILALANRHLQLMPKSRFTMKTGKDKSQIAYYFR